MGTSSTRSHPSSTSSSTASWTWAASATLLRRRLHELHNIPDCLCNSALQNHNKPDSLQPDGFPLDTLVVKGRIVQNGFENVGLTNGIQDGRIPRTRARFIRPCPFLAKDFAEQEVDSDRGGWLYDTGVRQANVGPEPLRGLLLLLLLLLKRKTEINLRFVSTLLGMRTFFNSFGVYLCFLFPPSPSI